MASSIGVFNIGVNKKELFEIWFSKNCGKIKVSRALEMVDNHYKYMQTQNDYKAFCAGIDSVLRT